MSDETLRELERTWRRTGDPADEERWHRARVRFGALEGWRLEAAEKLGWPGGLPEEPQPGLISRLLRPGKEPERVRLREVLTLLLRRSSEGHDRVLVAAGEQALLEAGDDQRRWLRWCVDELAGRVLDPGAPKRAIGGSMTAGATWREALAWGMFLRTAEELEEKQPELLWLDISVRGRCAPPPRSLFPALVREVVPWLLGTGDPLRERAERALDAIQVASPCEVPWDSMRGDDRSRTCDRCEMRVYDLSRLSRAEAVALLRRHEGQRLCISYYRREDGRVHTRDCPGTRDPNEMVRGGRV